MTGLVGENTSTYDNRTMRLHDRHETTTRPSSRTDLKVATGDESRSAPGYTASGRPVSVLCQHSNLSLVHQANPEAVDGWDA